MNITAKFQNKTYKFNHTSTSKSIGENEWFDFVAPDNTLDHNRKYKLVLDDHEKVTEYNFSCPIFKYRCSKLNLKMDLCMEEDLFFYYLFHGLDNQF